MARLVRRGLVEEGVLVDVAPTGDDALWRAGAAEYDAIVLDVMLPGIDGFEVCRRLRASGNWAPVLMLTARADVEDRVAGPRRRRGRLPDEAVLVRGAARTPARARAASAAASARRCCKPATSGSTRRLGQSGAARSRSTFPRRSSRCSRRSCAAPGQVLVPARPARPRLGLRLREPLERRRRLRPLSPREDRPAVPAHLDRDGARGRLPAATGRRRATVRRLPIRLRLALAFALATAVVLVAIGALLTVSAWRRASTRSLDDSLARAVE